MNQRTTSLNSIFLLFAALFLTDLQSIAQEVRTTDEEKLYLITDRHHYNPGETIFYSLFVVNDLNKPVPGTYQVKVHLLDGKDQILDSNLLVIQKGRIAGYMRVPQKGGQYKLRAFTSWQLNFKEEHFFEKDIFVQEFIERSYFISSEFVQDSYIPGETFVSKLTFKTLDDRPLDKLPFKWNLMIDGQLAYSDEGYTDATGKATVMARIPGNAGTNAYLVVYSVYKAKTEVHTSRLPMRSRRLLVKMFNAHHGKNLIANVKNEVVIKSVDENNLPASLKGVLLENGTEIDSIKTGYKGLAKIAFTPKTGSTYQLAFNHPDGTWENLQMMPVKADGCVIWFTKNSSGLAVHVGPGAKDKQLIISDASGTVVKKMTLAKGTTDLLIERRNVSEGIISAALYDGSKLIAHRLTLLEPVEPEVKITTYGKQTDLNSYVKGRLEWSFKEHGDLHYALRVVNTQYLNQVKDRSHTIRSWIYLGSEFTTEIEEADVYFQKDHKAYQYLQSFLDASIDYWRRDPLTGRVLGNENDYFPRGAVSFSGYIRSSYDYYTPVKNAVVRIHNTNIEVKTDSAGQFTFSNIPMQYLDNQILLVVKKGLERMEYTMPNHQYYLSNSFSAAQGISFDQYRYGLSPIQRKIDIRLLPSRDLVMGMEKRQLIGTESNSGRRYNATSPSNMESMIDGSRINSLSVASSYYLPIVYYNTTLYGTDYGSYNNYSNPFNVVLTTTSRRVDQPYLNERSLGADVIFWRPMGMGQQGHDGFRFISGNKEAGFSMICEGITSTGKPFRAEKSLLVQDAVSMTVKCPKTVCFGDKMLLQIHLSNNSDSSIETTIEYGFTDRKTQTVTLQAGEQRVIPAEYIAPDSIVSHQFYTSHRFRGIQRKSYQNVRIIPRGHPKEIFLTTSDKKTVKSFQVNPTMNGKMTIEARVVDNYTAWLTERANDMIRQPSGCFEQVSSSNYPNILAAQIVRQSDNFSNQRYKEIQNILINGYSRLAKYETTQGGFEWYGRTPPHESLTAYGLLQFHLMKEHGVPIDNGLVNRSTKWLLSRRDGKGGFKHHRGKYGFSSASYEVNNAYITYVLTRIGNNDLEKEIEAIQKDVDQTFDAYKLALLGNIYVINGKYTKAKAIYDQLMAHYRKNQYQNVSAAHSVMRSYGVSLRNECLALTLQLAHRLNSSLTSDANELIGYLFAARTKYGFGNTQATALTLEALSNYYSYFSEKDEDVDYRIYINDQMVGTYSSKELYTSKKIELKTNQFRHGINTLKVVSDKDGSPITLKVEWIEVGIDQTHEELDFALTYSSETISMEEATTITIDIENKTDKPKPQLVSKIAIPSGLSLSIEELKTMMDENVMDYYEFNDNVLNLYFLETGPKQKRTINLALTPSVPGVYHTPECSVYQYYTPEIVAYSSGKKITINSIIND